MVKPCFITVNIIWLILQVTARCYNPPSAFPVPRWDEPSRLKPAFRSIELKLGRLFASNDYDSLSVSIELTSSSETIWSHFHSPRSRSDVRPGREKVNGDSIYRIASITKAFTTLAVLQQHQAGNLSLDDTVDKILPDLPGELPWHRITIRSLASHLSGIPREFAQSDLITQLSDPTKWGLPARSTEGLPQCASYSNYTQPCSKVALLSRLEDLRPIFAPDQQPTYSNLAFSLLGLVIENITATTYTEYLDTAILIPLDMRSTTLKPPASNEHAVSPDFWYWKVDDGIEAPAGGLYSSSADMSKFIRHVLTHFNDFYGVNWLLPTSWAGGMNNFYGMPWEIFRTDQLLPHTRRPVTLVTKAGNVPGYSSKIYLKAEYGLGLTIFVGGGDCRGLLKLIEEIIVAGVVCAADYEIWDDVRRTYAGHYEGLANTSITLTSSPSKGLTLDTFFSNGTDVYHGLISELAKAMTGSDNVPWRAQLTPSLLYKNESTQQGEIWYLDLVSEQCQEDKWGDETSVFENFCFPSIVPFLYAGKPLTQVVFWREEEVIELPAWELSMVRSTVADECELLQDQAALANMMN